MKYTLNGRFLNHAGELNVHRGYWRQDSGNFLSGLLLSAGRWAEDASGFGGEGEEGPVFTGWWWGLEVGLAGMRGQKVVFGGFFWGFLALFLSGCAGNGPLLLDPVVPAPPQWQARSVVSAAQPEPWLQTFGDPLLVERVAEAMAVNQGLRVLQARAQAARARATVAGAGRFPELSAGLDGARSRSNQVVGGRVISAFSSRHSADLDLAWDVDIWGRRGHLARAARLEYEAAVWAEQAERLRLAANVAKSWFSATEAERQRQLVRKRLANLKKNLRIVEAGFRDGIYGALDVHLARADTASGKNRLAQAEGSRNDQKRALEVLMGRYPGATLQLASQLPAPLASVPVGLPSELLARRPDIMEARRRWSAADERAAEAGKNRFPSLRLTGSLGTASAVFRNLLRGDYLVWSLLGGLTAPIFDAGRRVAEWEQSQAGVTEASMTFGKVVLNAFLEVETALDNDTLLARREKTIALAARESVAAENLAFEQYRAGLANYVTVLEAQKRAFDSQSALIAIHNQRLQNRVDLFLALGGDFSGKVAPQVAPHVIPPIAQVVRVVEEET